MRWLFANLRYKLIAVGVAVLLWGAANSSSDVEQAFDVPIQIEGIPENLVLTDRSADELNVRITGSRATLRSLSAGDLEYPVSLAGSRAGETTREVDLVALWDRLPRGAKLASHWPSRVVFTLAPRATKAVRVRPDLEGEPAEGFEVSAIDVNPGRVRITGARPEVVRLSEVVTETIDLTGADRDVEREVRLSLGMLNVALEEPTKIKVAVRIESTQEAESTEEAAAGEETG